MKKEILVIDRDAEVFDHIRDKTIMKIMYHVEVCTPAVPPELYNSSTDKEKTYDMNEIMNILNAAEVFGAAYSASLQN